MILGRKIKFLLKVYFANNQYCKFDDTDFILKPFPNYLPSIVHNQFLIIIFLKIVRTILDKIQYIHVAHHPYFQMLDSISKEVLLRSNKFIIEDFLCKA